MHLTDVPIAPTMRARPHELLRRLLIAASLVASTSLLLLGCSAGDADQAADSGIDFGPANVPLPPGQWSATGTVLKGEEESNEPPGTVLKRPWTFKKTCNPACHTVFFRWTLYGPSVTNRVPHGRIYTADFPPVEVPCVYPGGSNYTRHAYGQSHDSYRVWWSADRKRVVALEHQTETGCYRTPGLPTVTRWSAIAARAH